MYILLILAPSADASQILWASPSLGSHLAGALGYGQSGLVGCARSTVQMIRELGGMDKIDFELPCIKETDILLACSSQGGGKKGQALVRKGELFILLICLFFCLFTAGSRHSTTVVICSA